MDLVPSMCNGNLVIFNVVLNFNIMFRDNKQVIFLKVYMQFSY